jgi:hypothetical protein
MYCIDGVSTLKNCKPALIHEPLNRVKQKHAKNTFGVDLTAFKGFGLPAVSGGAPALAFA